jgi:hypothetical protein
VDIDQLEQIHEVNLRKGSRRPRCIGLLRNRVCSIVLRRWRGLLRWHAALLLVNGCSKAS